MSLVGDMQIQNGIIGEADQLLLPLRDFIILQLQNKLLTVCMKPSTQFCKKSGISGVRRFRQLPSIDGKSSKAIFIT